MKFRSKKENQSIQINKEAITLKKKLKIFPTFLTPIRISKEKGIIIDHACKLKKEGSRWFFLVPQDIKVISCPKLEIASLDPGIRKFQTLYSPDVIIKWETRRDHLKKLHDKIDLLNSLKSQKFIKDRGKFKIWNRISDLINDSQNKLVHSITKNFNKVLLPIFESQEIGKKLYRSTRRELFSLKHYQFQQKLINNKHDCKVIICDEAYTSKTCRACGNINNVGSLETFNCSSCNHFWDRDINGARNILIKYLIKN